MFSDENPLSLPSSAGAMRNTHNQTHRIVSAPYPSPTPRFPGLDCDGGIGGFNMLDSSRQIVTASPTARAISQHCSTSTDDRQASAPSIPQDHVAHAQTIAKNVGDFCNLVPGEVSFLFGTLCKENKLSEVGALGIGLAMATQRELRTLSSRIGSVENSVVDLRGVVDTNWRPSKEMVQSIRQIIRHLLCSPQQLDYETLSAQTMRLVKVNALRLNLQGIYEVNLVVTRIINSTIDGEVNEQRSVYRKWVWESLTADSGKKGSRTALSLETFAQETIDNYWLGQKPQKILQEHRGTYAMQRMVALPLVLSKKKGKSDRSPTMFWQNLDKEMKDVKATYGASDKTGWGTYFDKMIAEDRNKIGAPERVTANIVLDLGDAVSPAADNGGPSTGAPSNGELSTFTGGAVESMSPDSVHSLITHTTATGRSPSLSDSHCPAVPSEHTEHA